MSSQEILEKLKENIDSYEDLMQLRKDLLHLSNGETRSRKEVENDPNTSNSSLFMKEVTSGIVIGRTNGHISITNSLIAETLRDISSLLELLKWEKDYKDYSSGARGERNYKIIVRAIEIEKNHR